MHLIHPGAQPYSFSGTDIGCLLVHGFTGSPPELRPLGEHLAALGWAVEAPLLAGHGTDISDLSGKTWQDWLGSVLAGLERLRSQPVRDVYLIGLSMGGLLCLYLSQAVDGVSGVVTLNSPIWLRDRRIGYTQLLRLINSLNPRWFAEVVKDPRETPREAADALRFAYHSVSPRAMVELLKLIRQVRRVLGKVEIPVLVVQSRADETVVPKSAEIIYRSIASRDKQLCWLEESPHLWTMGKEAGQVFKAVEKFIVSRSEPVQK